jgi:uncharacterized protein (DUF608 family)
VAATPNRLFPPHLLHATWQSFAAAGFRQPVTGIVYRGQPQPTCGLPLGGLDTGCLDLEPNGTLGYCTIFNHLVEPRLLLNAPLLGLHCGGHTWVLVADRAGKQDRPVANASIATFPPLDYTPQRIPLDLAGVDIATAIDYWGHYPIADLEFATAAPVTVGLRAWSPFVPGDEVTSLLPGAVFDLTLRNVSDAPQEGCLAVSFPGFPRHAAAPPASRQALTGTLQGVQVQRLAGGEPWEMAYVLAAVNAPAATVGGPLGSDGAAWAALGRQLPLAADDEPGASLSLPFRLAAGAVGNWRVVLAWHAPHWRAGGAPQHTQTQAFSHWYARTWPDALTVARHLATAGDALLRRVIAWQEVLYNDPSLPGWLADSLINNLHLITECSVWGQARPPVGDWCQPDDGVFGLNECPRGCPQIECLPCSFYGNLPLVYFFPRAARSTLRAYRAYQSPDGRPPWIFGGATAGDAEHRPPYELTKPIAGYQTVLNGACYIVMVDRYWRTTGDDAVLAEFWDSLKRCNDFSLQLRPAYGAAQVVAMPQPGTDAGGLGDTEWFEAPEPGWRGFVTHAGGVRLAQVRLMERMATAMGDTAYGDRCRAWIAAGAQALEEHLWAGRCYRNFSEPETGSRSDLVFGYQLDGQWVTRHHGVAGAFPADRVTTTLATLQQINCRLSQSGAVNYANPDGSAARVGGYGTYSYFPPELYMLAMTFMYEGQRAFGLELLERCLRVLNCQWGYTWDAPNTVRGEADTGQRAFGADYYQNMMLWAVPAALAGQSLEGVCQPGGLIARVLAAGQAAD